MKLYTTTTNEKSSKSLGSNKVLSTKWTIGNSNTLLAEAELVRQKDGYYFYVTTMTEGSDEGGDGQDQCIEFWISDKEIRQKQKGN